MSLVACIVCDANKARGIKVTDGQTWCESCKKPTRSRSVASRNERIRQRSCLTFQEQARLFASRE